MKRDAMLGYFIKALENKNYKRNEIEKIIEEVFILEENLEENKARAIFYEYPEEKASQED